MERRKGTKSKASPLPKDYVTMVNEIFNAHFETSLDLFNQLKPGSRFEAHGQIYSDEVVVAISLLSKGSLSATTVYASSDFDPKASSPNIQDLLSACIDGIGSIFSTLLSPDTPELINQVAGETLSDLENVPFTWSETESNQRKIYLKVDKSNPNLDALAEEWLLKNDPEVQAEEQEEERATEDLFVTGGPKKNRTSNGSGTLH